MWEAYLFNRDAAFLRERAYPVLKEAAEFFLDWLVPEPGTGLLLSGPSISPENAFRINGRRTHVTMGPAMDQQIVRDLFENVLAAAAELGIDDAFTQETAAKLAKLAGPQVGTDGRLMEWRQEELVEADPGHRHISHAFGLYPGSQFTVRGTPDLAAAVRKSIEHRVANGGGGTGWSLGWLLNMWARLEAGGKAYSTLRRLLTDMTMDNLLDLHPPVAGARTNVFQMDGNLGGTAGIAEMLLQSHAGEIHLLPALPRQWSRGVVEGLKARGGFEVSMAWSDGALTTVSIRSRSGEECRVRVAGGEVRTLAVGMGETRWFDGQLSEVRAPQGLAAPRDVAVTGSTPTSLSLSLTWQPPLFEGRSVYGYDVQYAKRGESGFREWPHRGRAPGTTITGLERDAAWKVRVRARNASGPGAWSSAVEYTGDIVAPPPSPPPPPPVIDTIGITSNPGPDATYAAGDTIEVTVTFDETVAVTRMPQLTLNVGGVDQAANYGSGTGAALVFAYPVADSDLDTDGVSIEANRLSLNGGTIKDGSNNNAVLDHGGLAADSGHKVDAVKPQLAATGGAVVDGTRLTLTYDEALDGGSRPVSGDFTVSGGDRVRAVTGVRVNGSAVELTLDVVAEHGETGITVSYTPGMNPIQDTVGNKADGLSNKPVRNETPDTTAPVIEGIEITSNPGSAATYAAGDTIEVTVTFSETIVVTGTPQLTLDVGGRDRTANYRSVTGGVVTFEYQVAAGESDPNGVSLEADSLSLNGGTIKDAADNDADLKHDAAAAGSGHKVDGVKPQLAATEGAVVNGATLTLAYNEALDESSEPPTDAFTVTGGSQTRTVAGVSVNGRVVTLTLESEVIDGQEVTMTYRVPGTSPIQDTVGNDAEALTNQEVENKTVNTNGPGLEGIEISSDPGDDETYAEGDVIAVRVRFSETVRVDTTRGTPTLNLTVGNRSKTAGARSGPESTEVVFVYEVERGKVDEDGVSIPRGRISLNGGTIRDDGNNNAALSHDGLTADSGHRVDGVEPKLQSATVHASRLALSYDEALDEDSIPSALDFTVVVAGNDRPVIQVQVVSGNAVTLRLSSPVTAGETVIVSYRPGFNPVRDQVGNAVEALTDEPALPPLTTIAATGGGTSVTEGTAVQFTLTRELPTAAALTVGISVTERGEVIETAGSYEPPEEVTFTVGDTTATLTVLTEDDEQQESDGAVIATLQPGPDYRLGQSSTRTAQVTVEDDEGGAPPGPIGPGLPPVPNPVPSAPRNLEAVGGDEQVTLFWEVPEDDGGFAITDYEYLISGTGGGWISTGSTETTHTVTELTNGRVYLFQVRAVSAAGAGASSNRVEVTPGVGRLEFAHFANGSSITSELVLVNVFARPIRPWLYFYNREGERIAAESVVEVTEELEVTEDGSLTVQSEMQPLETLTISTHGQGEVVAGSVTVLSNGPIGGVLRFDLPGVGVAGVGAGQPLRDALFPARRQAGGISTAVAIRNLEAEELVVSCQLMQEGAVLQEVDIELKVNGQDGRFIEEVFTTTDTTDFVGMVRCTAPAGKLFVGVAVELDAGNGIFTTLPVLPVDRTVFRGGEYALDFAHFANGASITSDLVLVNVSIRPSRPAGPFTTPIPPTRPSFYFYDRAGERIAAQSVVEVTGELEVTEDGSLTVQTEMQPLEAVTISTHGQGEVVAGSLRVVAEGPIGGVLRFDLPGVGVAGGWSGRSGNRSTGNRCPVSGPAPASSPRCRWCRCQR